MARATPLFIALYALLNAVLYSGLLPLWEGFDEPFHYGYVQHLSTRHRLPVLGQTTLSREVATSLELVPVSHVVRGSNTHWLTYDQHFALPASDRVSRRHSLAALPAASQLEDSSLSNYEAHQAPLAYLVLAIPDALLTRLPVSDRLFYLRVICAVSAVMLTIAGVNVLAPLLQLSALSTATVLFLTFSSQMFWATTAHVANDWLGVPLAIWLLASAVQFYRGPTRGAAFRLAIVLSVGLLTKAYFLAFVPVVVTVVLWRRTGIASFLLLLGIPAAWYIRNMILYGTLSGTVESVAGIGLREAAAAMTAVPWWESIGFMARSSLWTGNNSFTTFSRMTLNLMLALLAIGFALRLIRGVRAAGAIVLAAIASYCTALLYTTAVTFVYREGASAGASPWYMLVLVPPLLCLILSGAQRSGRIGQVVSLALVLLWGYVLCATYVAKLIPLYAGYDGPRSNITALYAWYQATDVSDRLAVTSVAPPVLICVLTGVVIALCLLLAIQLCQAVRATSDLSPEIAA